MSYVNNIQALKKLVPILKYSNNLCSMKNQFNVIDSKVVEVKKVIVHSFRIADVEDPDLYAAEHLLKWQNSESGKWVMEHSTSLPVWHQHIDPLKYCYKYLITAELIDKDYTHYCLKWENFKNE
jgi:DUF2075 family protein